MSEGKAALVLTGGGARAAYQVGVLNAIRDIRGRGGANPFPILCGTSAGAVNATALAVYCDNFDAAVRKLSWIWRNFTVSQVYRADGLSIVASGLRWGSALMLGWLVRQSPTSLLDNDPLRQLLGHALDFDAIQRNIERGHLTALSVTASGYATGESLSFFQAEEAMAGWRRTQRVGVRSRITVEHLLASSAIPFVFPAIKINREFFGDGSMRQLAPVSPAIHLGADRILVIGAGRAGLEPRQRTDRYPSPAQIAGHALSSIFLDSLEVDLERLARINDTVGSISLGQREALGIRLKPIETLVIAPSRKLESIAARYRHTLPTVLRSVMHGVGATRRNGSTILSYLLFESGYTRALIELGYRDAMARRAELAAFLRCDAGHGDEAQVLH
ncbi:MAG: patatin-like phospholipase family protein [Rhodocyclaceae bacterium]|nr:patatin-like phospholipase family protein [Rhodocyclaceae bacterium]